MNKHFIFGLGLGYLFARGGARRNYGGATRSTGAIPWPIVKQGIIAEIDEGGNGKKYLESLKGETIKLPDPRSITFFAKKVEYFPRRKGEKQKVKARGPGDTLKTLKIGSLMREIYVDFRQGEGAQYARLGSALKKSAELQEEVIPWVKVKKGISKKGRSYLKDIKGKTIAIPDSISVFSEKRKTRKNEEGKQVVDSLKPGERIKKIKLTSLTKPVYVDYGDGKKIRTNIRTLFTTQSHGQRTRQGWKI